MLHKAYAFDWHGFQQGLMAILQHALASDDVAGLLAFIEANHAALKDPYQGDPLTNAWWNENVDPRDVHQVGEVALTRYFDPAEACGLHTRWMQLHDTLPNEAAAALLGRVVGPEGNPFDPGKQGAYFQPPEQVVESLRILRATLMPDSAEFRAYRALLETCVDTRQGLYVTF